MGRHAVRSDRFLAVTVSKIHAWNLFGSSQRHHITFSLSTEQFFFSSKGILEQMQVHQ